MPEASQVGSRGVLLSASAGIPVLNRRRVMTSGAEPGLDQSASFQFHYSLIFKELSVK
jgi:hypothetical protein